MPPSRRKRAPRNAVSSKRGPKRTVPVVAHEHETLVHEVKALVKRVMESADAIPAVAILESGYGKGKTHALQRVFDELAAEDPEGYWRSGLTPVLVPVSEDDLTASRKRIADETLCDPTKAPPWLWVGLPCGTASSSTVLGDPLLAALHWQLERQLKYLAVRGGPRGALRKHAGRAAGEVASAVTEQVIDAVAVVPAATIAKTLYKVAREFFDAARHAATSFGDVEIAVARELHGRVFELIDQLSQAGLTTIIVLDDAHWCNANTLKFLALALTARPAPPQQRFFEPQAPAAARRRLVVLATAWPASEWASDFAQWVSELHMTGVHTKVFSAGEGWLAGFEPDEAATVLSRLLPRLPAEGLHKVVRTGLREGRINPLLLMHYAMHAAESEVDAHTDVDAWLKLVPASIEDIAKRRFRALPPAAQDGARLAAALAPVIPRRALILALARRCEKEDGEVVLRALLDARYLITVTERPYATTPSRLVDELAFADDLDLMWLRLGLRRFQWIDSGVSEAVARWYREVLTFTAHDLEGEMPPLPVVAMLASVSTSLRIYESGVHRNAALDSFCRLVRAWYEAPPAVDEALIERWLDDEPELGVFAAALSPKWSAEGLRRAWTVARERFSRSRSAVVLADRILRSPFVDEHESARSVLLANLAYHPAAVFLAAALRKASPDKARQTLEQISNNPHTAITLAYLVRDEDPARAVAILEEVTSWPKAAIVLAKWLRDDDPGKARQVLLRVSHDATAAIELSRLVRATDPVESRCVLERLAHDGQVAVELSRLIRDVAPDESRKVLERVEDSPAAALELSRLIRGREPAEARAVLERFAAEDAGVAIELSRLLAESDPAGARAVLEPFRNDPNAAIELSRLLRAEDRRQAIEVLEGFTSDANVALERARLLQDEDPGAALESLASLPKNPAAAIALARLVREADPERARTVLEGVAADPMAAIELSRLLRADRMAEARQTLERVADNPVAAIELARLVATTDLEEAARVLERAPKHPKVALELAKMYSRMEAFDEAYARLKELAPADPVAALLMVRNAGDAARLLEAQAEVRRHLQTRTRKALFVSLQRASWSSEAVLRALPRADPDLRKFFAFLYYAAPTDAHAAGLYACLARDEFPSYVSAAKSLLMQHAASDPFCACELSRFDLNAIQTAQVLAWLAAHAAAGDRRSAYEWARLAKRASQPAAVEAALQFIESHEELTSEERAIYESVAPAAAVEFTKVRDVNKPWEKTTIWRACSTMPR